VWRHAHGGQFRPCFGDGAAAWAAALENTSNFNGFAFDAAASGPLASEVLDRLAVFTAHAPRVDVVR